MVSIDTIILNAGLSQEYKEFIIGEAKTRERFFVDQINSLYLSDGNGNANRITIDQIRKMNQDGILKDLLLSTLWEVAPDTYKSIQREKKHPLILRDELLKHNPYFDIYKMYNSYFLSRRIPTLSNVPYLITPELSVPVLYNSELFPYLNLFIVNDKKFLLSSEGVYSDKIETLFQYIVYLLGQAIE